jgi:hypothetical protein
MRPMSLMPMIGSAPAFVGLAELLPLWLTAARAAECASATANNAKPT